MPGQPQHAKLLPGQLEKPQLNLTSKYKLGFLITFVIVEVLVVARTVLLILETYTLPHSSCETNNTQTNSTICINFLVSTTIQAESNDSGNYFQVTDVLYLIHSFLHWPEYAFLAYGFYKLLVEYSTWEKTFRQKFKTALREELYENEKCKRFLSLLVIFALTIISLTPPFIAIISQAIIDSEHYTNCTTTLAIHYTYETFTILAHICSTLIIRGAMVVTTLAVKAVWFNIPMDVNTRLQVHCEGANIPEDEERASSDYYKCVVDYEKRRDKNIPILYVFQAWFVIQWFIYYFQCLVDLTRTLYPLIKKTSCAKLIIAYRGSYTIYDFLSFVIPHVCGSKMNSYHQKYLKEKRKEQLDTARSEQHGSQVQYIKAYSLRIEKDEDGDFVPKIPGTGINIPLDSSGYILSILLSIFALLGGFISFSM